MIAVFLVLVSIMMLLYGFLSLFSGLAGTGAEDLAGVRLLHCLLNEKCLTGKSRSLPIIRWRLRRSQSALRKCIANRISTAIPFCNARIPGNHQWPTCSKTAVVCAPRSISAQTGEPLHCGVYREWPRFPYPTHPRQHTHGMKRPSIARFVLEFRECRQKVGRRIHVITREFPHQPVHHRGAAHPVPESFQCPNCQRDNGQSGRQIG